VEDGSPVGDVVVGTELDPYADAVLTAAQSAGLRLVLTPDPAAPELAGRADEVLTGPSSLVGQIRRLQSDGQVVAVVAAEEAALAVADVGIGVVPPTGRVPWAADILCGPGLLEVPRLLTAVPAARTVSARGVTSAMAATFLGGLLSAVGGPARTARAVLPVTTAAGASLVAGTVVAHRVHRAPPPEAVLHTPWHALEPDEVRTRLPAPTTATDPAERRNLLTAQVPSLGAPLLRDIAIRGATTGAGALLAWQIGRVTGTRRRASTIALAALVGTQLGQTLLIGGRNPLVLATGLGSAALLAGLIQTPGLSQFFGCTPLGPLAWTTVLGSSTGATLLAAAAAPRLLPPAPPPADEEPTAQPPQPALPAGPQHRALTAAPN